MLKRAYGDSYLQVIATGPGGDSGMATPDGKLYSFAAMLQNDLLNSICWT